MDKKRSELLRRSRALVNSLMSVADRIESGKLTPGIEEAIDAGGAPVCAFGWAVVGAQKKLKTVPLRNQGGNYHTLIEFLNGDYEEGVPEDVKNILLDAVERIEEVNDEIFNPENRGPKVKFSKLSRKKVAVAVRRAARILEKDVVLAKPVKRAGVISHASPGPETW